MMFGLFGKKAPRSEIETTADKLIETLKLFRNESKSEKELFLTQAGVLHANFLGKYKSVEDFKALSDIEKGKYFLGSLKIENTLLQEIPAVKMAYVFYSCLIGLEDAGSVSTAKKLRQEFSTLRQTVQGR